MSQVVLARPFGVWSFSFHPMWKVRGAVVADGRSPGFATISGRWEFSTIEWNSTSGPRSDCRQSPDHYGKIVSSVREMSEAIHSRYFFFCAIYRRREEMRLTGSSAAIESGAPVFRPGDYRRRWHAREILPDARRARSQKRRCPARSLRSVRRSNRVNAWEGRLTSRSRGATAKGRLEFHPPSANKYCGDY